MPLTLTVTPSNQTGNCGLVAFKVTFQAAGDWQGNDNHGLTWHVTCHPGSTGCLQFVLSSSSYGVNANPALCSCAPFSLVFNNVNLNSPLPCSGTATFAVTP